MKETKYVSSPYQLAALDSVRVAPFNPDHSSPSLFVLPH